MFFKIADLIVAIFTLLITSIYYYLTYLIAKDVYEPSVSFSFNQISLFHLGFRMMNKSKVEVEVFGKLWAKFKGELFEFKTGFYGNKSPWILQPFTEGHGHFDLKDIANKKNVMLMDFVKENKIPSLEFMFQINYHKVGSNKWKKSSPQKFIYNFENNLFWLNV